MRTRPARGGSHRLVTRVALLLLLPACEGSPPSAPKPVPPATTEPVAASQPLATPTPPASQPTSQPAALPDGTPAQLAALDRAKAALQEGRLKHALAELEAAQAGPVTGTSVSAGLFAAQLHLEQGDLPAARAAHERLAREAPAIAEVQFAAGRFFFETGDLAQAEAALRRARALQPDLLPAHASLGATLVRAGRGQEAAEVMQDYELRLNRQIRRASDLSLGPGDRLAALELLSVLDDERATEGLIAALRDPEPDLRHAAATALADDGGAEALVALADAALAETDPRIRMALALELKRARDAAHRSAAGPLPALPAPATQPASAPAE